MTSTVPEEEFPENNDGTINNQICDSNKKQVEEKERLVDSPQSNEVLVVPPDGGWGWVVVVASFMCNLIVDGIIFSFGTFLDSISDEFSVSKAEVTLVGSLMSGFYLMAGPFASSVANGYGFRLVAIIGSILAAAAFALANFANNVTFLCVTYGVIGGIGFGFIYVPSIITIGFYFERWRALATGIAVCGSGIGTFLFAPLSEFLISTLGWKGALLFQGGLVLSCAFWGSLFRPLTPSKIEDLEINDQSTQYSEIPLVVKRLEEATKNMKRNSLLNFTSHQSSLPLPAMKDAATFPRIWEVYQDTTQPKPKSPEILSLSVPYLFNGEVNQQEKKPFVHLNLRRTRTVSERCDTGGPLTRDDMFYGASLARLPQYTSKSSLAYNISVTKTQKDLKSDDESEESEKSCHICPRSIKKMLTGVVDLSLMKSPSFLILAIGGFFTMMGFYVPYMYLFDRATARGMDKAIAVWLISSIGIANTFGRVLCGVVSSFPGVNALTLTNIALTVAGVASMISGLYSSEEYQFLYTVIFGLATACFASLRSIVVVDLLGLEKLTNAFGLLLLVQGVAAIIGAPLAGAFKNYTGNFDACFYLSGGVLLLSAVMCYPLNCVNKWEKRRSSKQNVEV